MLKSTLNSIAGRALRSRILAAVLSAPLLAGAVTAADAAFILRQPVSDNPATAPALTYLLEAFDQANAPLAGGYAFGNVPLPESNAGTIRVANQGTGTVVLASAALSGDPEIAAGPGANLCSAGMALAPAASCFAYPVFTPSGAAAYSAQFAVIGDRGAAVAVNLSGAGTTTVALNAFDATGNPLTGAVDYGAVGVGQTGGFTRAGHIRNTGTGIAVLTAPTLTGDASFSLLPSGGTANCGATASLAVNQYCNVYAAFAPSAVGSFSAAYTLSTTSGQSVTVSLTGSGATACAADKTVYTYTGVDQGITVPAGCTTALVKAWGAGGRAGGGNDGLAVAGGGGFAQRTLTGLAPGAGLVVVVGQGGAGQTATYGGGGAGIFHAAGFRGGAGGGLSGVFANSKAQANALIIAGGGGGSFGIYVGYPGSGAGGAGGGAEGSPGAAYQSYPGGGGGTQAAGGAASGAGTPGTALQGGAGAQTLFGTGGGGGYWGGGGSYLGGAGGGSGYAPGGTLTAGSGCTAANSADSEYVAGAGKGGCTLDASGGNGRVVIQWQQ